MDLRRLTLFLAVVDEGGFTAAAQAVHVAQPAVSLAVRELETELGAALFVRTRAGAVLTPAGEALVGPARQTLRDLATAAASVAAVTGLVAGRLDLASLPTLAADPLASIVGRFRHAHGGVGVRLAAPTDAAELAEAVRSGRAEVGLTERGRANDGLAEIALLDQDLVAVSPPGSADGGTPLGRRALAALPLVTTGPGTSLRVIVEEALAAQGLVPSVAVETEQRDALVPLVVGGSGTAVLPTSLAATAGALGAVIRPLRPPVRRHIVLVHRPGIVSPAARQFIDLATAQSDAR